MIHDDECDEDYHEGALAVIDVEAEVGAHPRLRVHHLQIIMIIIDMIMIIIISMMMTKLNKKLSSLSLYESNLKVWHSKLAVKSELESRRCCSVCVQ